MDHQRSKNMAKIRSKNTKPEMLLRSALFNKGLRYRIHDKELPGKPDLVFSKFRTVIFVNGCFWHLHDGCRDGRIPSSRIEYWKPKLTRNVQRDIENYYRLEALGWKIIVIWECDIEKNIEKVSNDIFDRLLKCQHLHSSP